jgi:hypothetical protein
VKSSEENEEIRIENQELSMKTVVKGNILRQEVPTQPT